jgi:hypothetical protein
LTVTLREWLLSPIRLPLKRDTAVRANASRGGFAIEKIEHVARGMLPAIPPGFLLTVRGTKLDSKNTGIGTKSDPYFEIHVPHPTDTKKTILAYRSEVIQNTLEPVWKQFPLILADVGGFDSLFNIIVFDFEKDGQHQEIGRVEGVSLREWSFGPHRHRLKNPDAVLSSVSRGAFCIDDVQPLDAGVTRVLPPAFMVRPSASKLERMDGTPGLGKSDPFFRIIATPKGSANPVTIYRSEVIKADLNPTWKPFLLNVADVGGLDTEFTVCVYDYDAEGPELIGEATTTLRNWTFGPYFTKLSRPDSLRSNKSRGAFSADMSPAEYDPLASRAAPAYQFTWSGLKLDNHDGPGNASDPFFEIRIHPPSHDMHITYYRSESIRDNLNPVWKDFVINTREVGGFDMPFEVLVWDEDRVRHSFHHVAYVFSSNEPMVAI